MGIVVVVCYEGDILADAVTSRLQQSGIQVAQIAPSDLGDLNVTLSDKQFLVNGNEVCGVLFRCSPNAHFSHSFVPEDQQFANVEQRSLWLAAIQLDSVAAINQYDSETWFDDSSWVVLRRRIIAKSIPVAPLVVGNRSPDESRSYRWLPYRTTSIQTAPRETAQRVIGAALTTSCPQNTYLMAGNRILTDGAPKIITTMQAFLHKNGFHLATITLDSQKRVVAADLFPHVDPPDRAADAIVEWLNGAVHIR